MIVDEGFASDLSTKAVLEIFTEARTKAETKWLAENRSAIDAHNTRIDEHGTLIKPIWQLPPSS